MATLRELKGRIGSVASSEKITGAMKMISSAKMHKAELALKRLLPFRQQIETILGNLLSADAEFSSPLTEPREVKRIGLVVLGSDDGLCGAYNVNIFKAVLNRLEEYRRTLGENVDVVIYPVGRKLDKAAHKIAGEHLKVASVFGVNSKTEGPGVKRFMELLRNDFTSGNLDRVDVMYMNFQSVSRQRIRAEQLLPIIPQSFSAGNGKALCRPYIFEPNASSIFAAVLPLFLLAMMQEVFVENRASEQAARIMAMQSANDNAKKLLEQLQLEFNKLRQQSITTELLDILGGQVK
ncbi:MAG: ATP synthase F1 subunit gamma [Muribaculaceae bacterium]|nr:ATP synthase F1 subunit gamma [Muribaculaceae bacterium]